MNSNKRKTPSHDMPDSFFAVREQAGPLTPMEACYRAIGTLGFTRLIHCDAVMGRAELTADGERWLEPVLRQVLHLDGPLPLAAVDWIHLYHRARDTALKHFSAWNRRVAMTALNENAMPRHRWLSSVGRHSTPCRPIGVLPYAGYPQEAFHD